MTQFNGNVGCRLFVSRGSGHDLLFQLFDQQWVGLGSLSTLVVKHPPHRSCPFLGEVPVGNSPTIGGWFSKGITRKIPETKNSGFRHLAGNLFAGCFSGAKDFKGCFFKEHLEENVVVFPTQVTSTSNRGSKKRPIVLKVCMDSTFIIGWNQPRGDQTEQSSRRMLKVYSFRVFRVISFKDCTRILTRWAPEIVINGIMGPLLIYNPTYNW